MRNIIYLPSYNIKNNKIVEWIEFSYLDFLNLLNESWPSLAFLAKFDIIK